ncbi:MAG: magnesium transporter [Turicibacter sp.]|nr:magnesium transporter [Turicibacter sp.]
MEKSFYEIVVECLRDVGSMNVLKEILNEASELELLDTLQKLSEEHQGMVYRLLAKDKALDVFEQLDTDFQQQLIRAFTDKAAIEIIEHLPPDDRVKLLDELPAKVAKKMLAALSPNERSMTNLLMGYEPDTAGRIMTPEYVNIQKGQTAAEALKRVKIDAPNKETIYTLYITDNTRKLEGVISLRDLLIADPNVKIEDIMEKITATVATNTDQEEVARILQKMDWLAIPVVDKENRLVGIITFDDIAQIIEDEATEDIEIMGALNPSETPYLKTGIFRQARNRIVWLMFLMLSATFTGLIIAGFEESLEAAIVLATFIPMLMGTAGNAGSQAATLVIRGMALGDIQFSDLLSVLWREIRISALCGIALAAANFIRIIFLTNVGDYLLALTVSLALIATVIMSKTVGCLLPLFAKKINVDPAVMATPLITTIVDAAALIIFFSFATLILNI